MLMISKIQNSKYSTTSILSEKKNGKINVEIVVSSG